jgi:hypothetical protein
MTKPTHVLKQMRTACSAQEGLRQLPEHGWPCTLPPLLQSSCARLADLHQINSGFPNDR